MTQQKTQMQERNDLIEKVNNTHTATMWLLSFLSAAIIFLVFTGSIELILMLETIDFPIISLILIVSSIVTFSLVAKVVMIQAFNVALKVHKDTLRKIYLPDLINK